MRRREMAAEEASAKPPSVSSDFDGDEVQRPEEGSGPLYHRRYRVVIADARLTPSGVMARVQADPNLVAPTEFARFERIRGRGGAMRVNDEYVVHIPGPWNGPVRVAEVADDSFRLVTLRGHLEAGQIEFRVTEDDDLAFQIQSWARSGDPLSSLLYNRLRMAKEIQLHMWTSTLERVVRLAGGSRKGRISIETHRYDVDG
ncbi:MAG: DUF1990 family protein [Actinomycetota bacterium]